MKIKMIVTDLDGTLLRDDKTISGYTKTVILKCRERGIKVIFATVRGTVNGILLPDMFDGCVLKSGALAYGKGELIYKRVMSIDDVRDLLLACDRAGLEIVAENCDDGLYYTNYAVSEIWGNECRRANFAQARFCSDKIYITAQTAEAAGVIKGNIPKGVNLFISRDNYAFISHEEAVKAKAAASLAAHYGIKREEIIGFGDDLIDIDLLRYCGIGVAMGNALPEVKEAADYICDTNNNDGVAKWIDERVLGF
jgi:Cof subfamily protein (haloacid dehalogenase superfamily)